MDHFYIHLADQDELFSNNTPYNFTVALPCAIKLTGRWSVGLWEIKIDTQTEENCDIFICCSVVLPSFSGRRCVPVLRRLYHTQRIQTFNPVQYVMIDNTSDVEYLNFTMY